MADAERCVCCGKIIPEGLQVCPACEAKYAHTERRTEEINRFINTHEAVTVCRQAKAEYPIDGDVNHTYREGWIAACEFIEKKLNVELAEYTRVPDGDDDVKDDWYIPLKKEKLDGHES